MRTQVVNPDALDSLARADLVREVFALHEQVFSGVSLVSFRRQVFDGAGAVRTRLLLARAQGELVAYSALHVFEASLGGRVTPVLRGEAGALPRYRRQLFMWRLWAREVLRVLVAYGRAPWYVGTFVHPSAYLALGRLTDVVPRPGQPFSPALLEQLERACRLHTEGLAPGLARVGWVTRESEEDLARWHARPDDLTRYYLAANPGYGKGVGLTVAVRFDFRQLVRGVWRALMR